MWISGVYSFVYELQLKNQKGAAVVFISYVDKNIRKSHNKSTKDN